MERHTLACRVQPCFTRGSLVALLTCFKSRCHAFGEGLLCFVDWFLFYSSLSFQCSFSSYALTISQAKKVQPFFSIFFDFLKYGLFMRYFGLFTYQKTPTNLNLSRFIRGWQKPSLEPLF